MNSLTHKSFQSTATLILQYTLTNPNRGVPIFLKSVPISEFARISEIVLVQLRINNTNIRHSQMWLISCVIPFYVPLQSDTDLTEWFRLYSVRSVFDWSGFNFGLY